jgi:hypothetical protein
LSCSSCALSKAETNEKTPATMAIRKIASDKEKDSLN